MVSRSVPALSCMAYMSLYSLVLSFVLGSSSLISQPLKWFFRNTPEVCSRPLGLWNKIQTGVGLESHHALALSLILQPPPVLHFHLHLFRWAPLFGLLPHVYHLLPSSSCEILCPSKPHLQEFLYSYHLFPRPDSTKSGVINSLSSLNPLSWNHVCVCVPPTCDSLL